MTVLISTFAFFFERSIVQRLATIVHENIGEHFSRIYDKVRFVRQEGELFLYDIEKEMAKEEYKGFYLAESFYKKNEKRSFPWKNFNQQEAS